MTFGAVGKDYINIYPRINISKYSQTCSHDYYDNLNGVALFPNCLMWHIGPIEDLMVVTQLCVQVFISWYSGTSDHQTHTTVPCALYMALFLQIQIIT